MGKWLRLAVGVPQRSPHLALQQSEKGRPGRKKRLRCSALAKKMGLVGDPEVAKPTDLEGWRRPGSMCILLSD